jgi:hypothetical protein
MLFERFDAEQFFAVSWRPHEISYIRAQPEDAVPSRPYRSRAQSGLDRP